jgi:hypothetical protein
MTVILQILPSLVTGGVERGTVDMAAYVAAQGWTSLVASSGGPMGNPLKARTYVLVDVLPKDLQERIKTAFEALSWG